MNFKWLYNIRIVLANISRSLTLLIGIAAATMAVVLSGVYQHAYDDKLDEKVPMAMMGGKYEYSFSEFQQENIYGGNAIMDVSFGVEGTDSMFNLVGIDDGCELFEARTVSGEPFVYGGYYMTSSAARVFGVKAGEVFTFYNVASMKSSMVHIDGIIDNDVGGAIKVNTAQQTAEAFAYDLLLALIPYLFGISFCQSAERYAFLLSLDKTNAK